MVDLGDGEQHREHQRVDPHEDERVDQRPEDAEKRCPCTWRESRGGTGSRTARDGGEARRTPTSLTDSRCNTRAMSALVSAIAFPVCAAVIWIALRTPLAARLAAKPSSERWHTRETPALGGIGVFAGILAGVGLAIAVGAVERERHPARDHRRRADLLFAVGLLDDAFGLPVAGEAGGSGRRGGDRSHQRPHGRAGEERLDRGPASRSSGSSE